MKKKLISGGWSRDSLLAKRTLPWGVNTVCLRRGLAGGWIAFGGGGVSVCEEAALPVRVHIRFRGNRHLGFRPYGGSLGKAPSNQALLPLSFGASPRLGMPSLRSCSVGPPRSAIHGRARLPRHPCRGTHCAEPPLSLSRGRAPPKSRSEAACQPTWLQANALPRRYCRAKRGCDLLILIFSRSQPAAAPTGGIEYVRNRWVGCQGAFASKPAPTFRPACGSESQVGP